MTTLLNQEIKNSSISEKTVELKNIQFLRADGSVETVNGSVEIFCNGYHNVLISGKDILRLKLTMDEFESASDAMSRAAFKE